MQQLPQQPGRRVGEGPDEQLRLPAAGPRDPRAATQPWITSRLSAYHRAHGHPPAHHLALKPRAGCSPDRSVRTWPGSSRRNAASSPRVAHQSPCFEASWNERYSGWPGSSPSCPSLRPRRSAIRPDAGTAPSAGSPLPGDQVDETALAASTPYIKDPPRIERLERVIEDVLALDYLEVRHQTVLHIDERCPCPRPCARPDPPSQPATPPSTHAQHRPRGTASLVDHPSANPRGRIEDLFKQRQPLVFGRLASGRSEPVPRLDMKVIPARDRGTRFSHPRTVKRPVLLYTPDHPRSALRGSQGLKPPPHRKPSRSRTDPREGRTSARSIFRRARDPSAHMTAPWLDGRSPPIQPIVLLHILAGFLQPLHHRSTFGQLGPWLM